MKVSKGELKGLHFWHREGTSDLKTFQEVVGKDVYQKQGNKLLRGEFWYDCGGNVGAFALLALSKGAGVQVYEPDPFNCDMIERNLKLNGFSCKVIQAALVHDETRETNLYIGNNGNVWRNSIVKNWNGKGLVVPCLNFDAELQDGACVKMDIEGAEMPILETTQRLFKKLVFEWSFDIDPRFARYRAVLEKMDKTYTVKANRFASTHLECFPDNWFPACTNVFCHENT